jgi:hypothetical protein
MTVKSIECKCCGSSFVVAELGKNRVSLAEAEGLCGSCYWKKHDIYELERALRNIR